MYCPVCGNEMLVQDFGLKVEVCADGCRGIWFDHGELERLDQAGAGMGAALEAALKSPRANTGPRAPISCPRCGIPMHTHRFNRDKEVNVDECYGCGGFFLDSGELKEIRDHYMSDQEVRTYADQIISKVGPGFGDAERRLDHDARRTSVVGHLAEEVLGIHYWRKNFFQ